MYLRELSESIEQLDGLGIEDIPNDVRKHTGKLIADTIGVGVAGAHEPEIAALIRATQGRAADAAGLPGARRVWGGNPGVEFEPATTAFLNAAAGCNLELDEGMRPTGHPAMHVVPAVLALAGAEQSIDEVVRAVVIGYEVAASLFRNLLPTSGVHPHGGIGSIGAAVGGAQIIGADPVMAARVAAATPMMSTWTACFEGASARSAFMGYGASIGVRAAEMARAGFVGIGTELPIVENGLATWAEDRRWWDGDEFACTTGYVKFHSACALSHTVIDAARRITREVAASPARVFVEVNANGTKLDRLPRDNPLSRLFSLQHAAASALADQSFPVRTQSTSDRVGKIAQLVTVAEDPALTELWPAHSAARVTVTSTTGESEVVERLDPDGFQDPAFIDTELVGKFTDLTGDWPLAAETWRTWVGEDLP